MLAPHSRQRTLALLLLALTMACGDSDPRISQTAFPATPRTEFGGNRPVTLEVPSTYHHSRPAPLLLVLHGYGADGSYQAQYFKVRPLVESQGVLLLAPNGTHDASGRRFWNATPACCNFNGSTVDDVAYLRGLLREVRRDYNVDPRRIYVVGHSNGGFMAHRLACELTEIAGIVSLAGSTFMDATACTPSAPVSVLNIHGDADETIRYEGASIGNNTYPGALETTRRWQVYNRCSPNAIDDPTKLNLEGRVPGDETEVRRYVDCAAGSGVELWSIHLGSHIPTFTRDIADRIWVWLEHHPKP